MIIEVREYAIRVGGMSQFVELYRSEGFPIQLKYLRCPVGFFTSETGNLSRFVHMWLYSSYDERDRSRAELHDDLEWKAYVPRSHQFIESMHVDFLTVLDFGSKPRCSNTEMAEND